MSNNGSINDALDKAQRGLLDFFFPRKCPFCGRVAGRELLCEACKASLPRCDKVRTGTFGECAAPLYYEGRVRAALLAFKFKRRIEDLNAYGVLMASKGYSFLWAGFVSAFAFCGSMQYVAITLLTTAFDPLQAFVLSLMVNARHLFFSLALLPKYRGLGRLRYFMIYTLSDENFSLSSSVEPPEDTDPTLFYFAMSFLTWLYWVACSMLGGLLGGLITFDITGIDFALTALFVVLFIEQVVKKENRAPGAAGLVCAVAGLAVFGADNMVIPAMVLTLAVLLLGRRKLCA